MIKKLFKKEQLKWWRPFIGSCLVGLLVWWTQAPTFSKSIAERAPASDETLLANELNLKLAPNDIALTAKHIAKIRADVILSLAADREKDPTLRAAVYFEDLRTHLAFGFNEKDEFRLGSLIKIPVLIATLRMLEQNPELNNLKVRYDEDQVPKVGSWDLPFFHPNPKRALKNGHTYSFNKLMYKMIALSGNQPLEVLANLATKQFEQVFTDMQIPVPDYDAPMGTPEATAKYFGILFNSSYLSSDSSRKALDLLMKSDFHMGLEGGLPAGVAIAHKFGVYENPGVERDLHECGLIYLAEHPYTLCVFLRGSEFLFESKILESVSRVVYQDML